MNKLVRSCRPEPVPYSKEMCVNISNGHSELGTCERHVDANKNNKRAKGYPS